MVDSSPERSETTPAPRPGYTLPVFACAAALAALRHLQAADAGDRVSLDLLRPAERVEIPIEQVARLDERRALAIARSDPGDNLDLTRNMPVWALVEMREAGGKPLEICGGEGIGRNLQAGEQAAIYRYARELLQANLLPQLAPERALTVTIILPEGRRLAERTSNAAFGIVEGLSLLGTTGISQPLSAPGQLTAFQAELTAKAAEHDCLVFCLGENGLALARQLGINSTQLVKTANWLGPMLVAAGALQLPSLLLLGYHGKLIKLAGGIFHTHHYLADGRLAILTAFAAQYGLPTTVLQQLFTAETAEAALGLLRQVAAAEPRHRAIVEQTYAALTQAIDERSRAYIQRHAEQAVQVGSAVFDRDRAIIASSPTGTALLAQLC